MLEMIIREPPSQATASVIWLHGLGADGNDFAGIIPMLGLPASHEIRFVFPHAPYRPITLNAGMTMRGGTRQVVFHEEIKPTDAADAEALSALHTRNFM